MKKQVQMHLEQVKKHEHNPVACSSEQIVPSLDLEMETTPLDSDDDGTEDRDAGSWLTVASTRKKRSKAPVVMKLKGRLLLLGKVVFGRTLSTKRVFLRMMCRWQSSFEAFPGWHP